MVVAVTSRLSYGKYQLEFISVATKSSQEKPSMKMIILGHDNHLLPPFNGKDIIGRRACCEGNGNHLHPNYEESVK